MTGVQTCALPICVTCKATGRVIDLDEESTQRLKTALEAAHQAIWRAGGGPTRVQMNCSGKHSGMVVTCAVNHWSMDDYLHVDHPLQKRITDTIPDVAGEEAFSIGVDGCGAPAHVLSLTGLARALRAMATGAAGDSGLQIHRAMSQHSYMVGGEKRDVTAICTNVPGLMAKDGAEAVYVAALPDGRAVALKLSDGFGRGTATVLVAALKKLGVDTSNVPDTITEVAYGHGKPVGRIRAVGF